MAQQPQLPPSPALTHHQPQRLLSPFSIAASASSSPPRARSPPQHPNLATTQQRRETPGHTRRSRSESAIIVGVRREGAGRARAGTEAAMELELELEHGRARGFASLIDSPEGEEDVRMEEEEQSRKRRSSAEEEESEREQEAARILATGLSPRSVRPTSAVRGGRGGSGEGEVKPRVFDVDLSPEDEGRSLLRRYTVASPSPLRKRTKVEDGGALRGRMSSPLRYGGSDEPGIIGSSNIPLPPIIHPVAPARPLLFPPGPAPGPSPPAPSFISARLNTSTTRTDHAPPPTTTSSLAPPLSLQDPPSHPPRPLQFDLLPPLRTSRRLTPQPAVPSYAPPPPSTTLHSIARPTPRPTLPPGHPHPLHSPPSPSLLPNLQTLLASYHLLPAGSLEVLEELVKEGMRQLSGERRGESSVAEAVRRGREGEGEGRKKAAQVGRGRAVGRMGEGKKVAAEGGGGGGPSASTSTSVPSKLPNSTRPMRDGTTLRFIEETGLEKEVELERREERRAVRERVGGAAGVKKEGEVKKGKGVGRKGV